MLIIVGLGNPGEKFKNTRHNAGFMAVDFFAEKNGLPDFKFSKKYESLVFESGDIMLVKPQIFMNESGRTVKKIAENSKESELIVIHDDIDLPLGRIKFSKDSGSGGHKGIYSIIKNIGNENLTRLRIGICPEKGKPKNVEKFVIQKFTKEEKNILKNTIEKSAQAIDYLIEKGLEKTMNEYNR